MALTFELLKWQKEVLSDNTRFKVVCAGRRCGKSRLAATELLIYGLRCPAGSAVMYVAPTQGQARVIIWDVLMNLGREVIASSHVNNMEITLVNGIRIYIRGADRPDTLRGVSLSFVVLDEYADMKPIVWEQIIRASLSDKKGDALFIGTPKGRNHFHDIFLKGGDDPDYKSWSFTTADNELIDPKEIEDARRTLSTFAFKQEYLASFDTLGTDIFKEEWLKYGKEPQQGSWYISVDLAGFEAVGAGAANSKKRLDLTAISVVKVGEDGRWFVKKIEHGRWDVRETAVRILKNIREFRPLMIGIERGTTMNAVMPYLADLMRKNNIFAHVHPLTHGNEKKTDRIVWALQGMFEHGRVVLNGEGIDHKNSWQHEFIDEYLMFPTKGVHDDCFPSDAPIITLDGIKAISDITTDDYVFTRNGFRRVLKAWCKGYKPVITRYGITATPEHLVFTENRGWVRLDSIADDDMLITCNPIKEPSCEKQSNSMGGSITDTPMQKKAITGDITHAMTNGLTTQDCSIETYGSSTTGKYQKDTISTTKTEILVITTHQTLSAYQWPHTRLNIEEKEAREVNLPNNSRISIESEAAQRNGIPHQKVLHGIKNMQRCLSAKTTQKSSAPNAGSDSNRKLQSKYYAGKNAAELEKTGFQESGIPVYDLMVDTDHEFFAYGVLVHNCIDSLAGVAQMAITSYAGDDDSDEYEPLDIITGV